MKRAYKSLGTFQNSKILLLIATKFFFVQLLLHGIKYIRSIFAVAIIEKEWLRACENQANQTHVITSSIS